MPAESATARYIEYTDTAFDGDGVDGERAFIQNETVGGFSNVRMHGCNVWNAETAISGAVDGLRVRLSEFHGVDELDDGSVMDLETHQNDWW